MKIIEWIAIRCMLLLSLILLSACSYNSFNRTFTIQLPETRETKPATTTPLQTAPPVIAKKPTPVPVKRKVVAKKAVVKKSWSCVKMPTDTLPTPPATPSEKLRTLKPNDKDGMVRVLLDYIKVLKEHNAELAAQLRVVNGQLQKCHSR